MYKFTNGIVVFDEETKNQYIKAGYKLVEGQMNIEEVIKEVPKEVDNENREDNSIVEGKSKPSKKISN